jgi:DNA-directed RNA polymerase subunit RPC12/RpoP
LIRARRNNSFGPTAETNRKFFLSLKYHEYLIRYIHDSAVSDQRPIVRANMRPEEFDTAARRAKASLEDLRSVAKLVDLSHVHGAAKLEHKDLGSKLVRALVLHQAQFFHFFTFAVKPTYQMDDFRFPSRRQLSRGSVCPYCGERTLVEWTSKMHSHQGFSRRVQDCLNCWPIFDGDAEVLNGIINIHPNLMLGERQSIGIQARPSFRGTCLALGGVVLDPFLPTVSPCKPISMWQGRVDISADVLRVNLPDLPIPREFPPGRHQIRACLLLNEHVAFMYHDVYLIAAGHPASLPRTD